MYICTIHLQTSYPAYLNIEKTPVTRYTVPKVCGCRVARHWYKLNDNTRFKVLSSEQKRYNKYSMYDSS